MTRCVKRDGESKIIMYNDDDLNKAVEVGIFTAVDVASFRESVVSSRNSTSVDEEHFKLIGGFNDIFIVVACGLLLFSSFSALKTVNIPLSYMTFALLSWGLAEFFVLRRKMALPAIMLLIAFVGSVAGFSHSLLMVTTSQGAILATTLSTLAAFIHWQRFSVPITVAVAVIAAIGLVISLLRGIFPEIDSALSPVLFLCGLAVFALAMFWDAADTTRLSYRSDVAFWLHLLAAPLIIHPVFSGLGITHGDQSLLSLTLVILLYGLLTLVSISLDRRIFMVSALMYVIYALSGLIDRYGMFGSSFAMTGMIIGAMLLLLSAYWHRVRAYVVRYLPKRVQDYVPKSKVAS